MTLGSIFEKLSGITLRSIAKWYGIVVLAAIVLVIAFVLAMVLGKIAWSIITALGFWGTLTMILVGLGFASVSYFKDEIFPDSENVWERHMRHTMLRGTGYKATPYNFRTPDTNEWDEIRQKILEMGDVDTITIFYKGKPFEFKSRSDALSFVTKIETETE